MSSRQILEAELDLAGNALSNALSLGFSDGSAVDVAGAGKALLRYLPETGLQLSIDEGDWGTILTAVAWNQISNPSGSATKTFEMADMRSNFQWTGTTNATGSRWSMFELGGTHAPGTFVRIVGTTATSAEVGGLQYALRVETIGPAIISALGDGNLIVGPTSARTSTANLEIVETVSTSSAARLALKVTGAAHTTIAASTEILDVDFALNRTVQHATGALTTQRSVLFRGPTYSFVGASTLTDAATVAASAPVAGTNATITNSHAFWAQTGGVRLSGTLRLDGSTSGHSSFQAAGTTTSVTYTLPSAAPASNDYVLACSTAGVMSWVAQSGGGSSVWNDLTDPDGNLALDMSSFSTTFTWDNENEFILSVSDSATDTAPNALILRHITSGSPAVDFGVALRFMGTNAAAGVSEMGRIVTVWEGDEDVDSDAKMLFYVTDSSGGVDDVALELSRNHGVYTRRLLDIGAGINFGGQVANGGGAAPTVGTIGGSGPATAAQSGWLPVLVGGNARFIPLWA